MIRALEISKSFCDNGDLLPVFEKLCFTFPKGETVSILGPSGCGKSTLLRCLSGLTDYEGEITIDGCHPKKMIESKEIGFMFQDSVLIPWKSALENVLLSESIGKRLNNSKNVKARALYLLEMVGLSNYSEFYPNQLSGGMRQRIAIARTFLHSPKVIMLDEPFAAIDALTRLKLISDLGLMLRKQNATSIIVTHNIEEAVLLGNRVLIMSKRPAKIIRDISIQFSLPRDIELLNNIEFIKYVNTCREILFRNEN